MAVLVAPPVVMEQNGDSPPAAAGGIGVAVRCSLVTGGAKLGETVNGEKLELDFPVLVDTRLLIQANSAGGKSCLLRLIAEGAGIQTIVLDNELRRKQ